MIKIQNTIVDYDFKRQCVSELNSLETRVLFRENMVLVFYIVFALSK